MSYTKSKVAFLGTCLVAWCAPPTRAQTLTVAQLRGVWQQSSGAVSAALHYMPIFNSMTMAGLFIIEIPMMSLIR
jgi:hypothetical protein